jgi:hypothetical protein
VKVEDVHRYMWSRVDGRHRVQMMRIELIDAFEVHRDVVNQVLLEMRATGRIKYVGCRVGKRYVYEITDPDTFMPGDDQTHLRRPRQPAWG